MSSFRALVIGGGFTGLEVLRRLAPHKDIALTLVDPSSHALFTPRLVDALAGRLPEQAYHLSHQTLAQKRGYAFLQGRVEALDPSDKTARIREESGRVIEYAFDVCVCAFGARTAFFGLVGQEYVLPFKTWEHLTALETRLRELATITHPRIAIVGGGATGVEAAVALHERLGALGLPIGKRSIDLYQAAPQILPGFSPTTVRKTQDLLEELGVRIHTHASVTETRAQSLILKTGIECAADLILWAPGVEPHVLEKSAHLSHDERGALLPDHTLRLAPGVFAGGDVVMLREGQRPVPKNAQTAMKMGAVIANNILRERAGKPLISFSYHSPGVMLWLGRTSIAELGGLSLASPFFTWARSLFYRLRWRQLAR